MSRLAAALSTFCSCNKAGSIPQFTKHLSQFPNDYVALIWRARAHGIVGNKAECKMDLLHAISVSSGAQKQVAQAELEYTNGNMEKYVSLLQTTIRDYPNYAPAWSNLGSFCENCNQHKEALTCLTKAVEVAKANNETSSPWFCWDNHAIAEIYLRQVGDIDRAEEYYRAALGSCETLTVAHMGLCQVHLARDKIAHARRRFEKAKQLNPKLIHWSNFEAFRTEVEAAKGRPTARAQVDSVTESVANLSMGKRSQESTKYGQDRSQTASASGGKRRGGNNGGGNGSGSGSDDDDSGPDADPWQWLKKESPWVTKVGSRQYAQSKDGKYWYSKDTARHGTDRQGTGAGGAYLKRYVDRGRTIEFDCSVDRNLRKIEGKHESRQGTSIKKTDMDTIRRK